MYHYDFLSRSLAKLERGHTKDLVDVGEMLRLGLVTAADLRSQAEAIRPGCLSTSCSASWLPNTGRRPGAITAR